ncbi:uncharacterized protein LY89DRAFT_734025 [Mollisia scopiformis]|uniref:Uncharacterized protein n=1 Tax=Mollisia scopiformis TaxID=149040 RepID=A0A194XB95_MOLSC|nr:uncharacterized protein LY89DRAFT_734025 [Mollisia scopiformis]KUJ17032.1 hypothetical protein LY89DRAFT_734025 [Mollisia scopiformis]
MDMDQNSRNSTENSSRRVKSEPSDEFGGLFNTSNHRSKPHTRSFGNDRFATVKSDCSQRNIAPRYKTAADSQKLGESYQHTLRPSRQDIDNPVRDPGNRHTEGQIGGWSNNESIKSSVEYSSKGRYFTPVQIARFQAELKKNSILTSDVRKMLATEFGRTEESIQVTPDSSLDFIREVNTVNGCFRRQRKISTNFPTLADTLTSEKSSADEDGAQPDAVKLVTRSQELIPKNFRTSAQHESNFQDGADNFGPAVKIDLEGERTTSNKRRRGSSEDGRLEAGPKETPSMVPQESNSWHQQTPTTMVGTNQGGGGERLHYSNTREGLPGLRELRAKIVGDIVMLKKKLHQSRIDLLNVVEEIEDMGRMEGAL